MINAPGHYISSIMPDRIWDILTIAALIIVVSMYSRAQVESSVLEMEEFEPLFDDSGA